ncbi:MAG: DciA family protein [Methylococcales bacterium]|nr:DciA family protein [Methylococcales bacterium]
MSQKPPAFKTSLSFHSRTIAYFYSQIEQQKRALQRIQAVLPEPLAKQVRHCLIKDKKLLIYTDSAAWASQLRFYNYAILAAIAPLTRTSIALMQVKIIAEQTGLVLRSVRKANIPSGEKIAIIRNDSLSIRDDQLKQALLRLSATLERLSGNP